MQGHACFIDDPGVQEGNIRHDAKRPVQERYDDHIEKRPAAPAIMPDNGDRYGKPNHDRNGQVRLVIGQGVYEAGPES